MDVDALIDKWRRYARSNHLRAELDQRYGDVFGAELRRARGEVRERAAAMLERARGEPATAAKKMHGNARDLYQHHWPFAGFDQAAVKYTKARTWQDCAKAIDPSLPEIQPRLSE